jgi:hypothetical protein
VLDQLHENRLDVEASPRIAIHHRDARGYGESLPYFGNAVPALAVEGIHSDEERCFSLLEEVDRREA